MTNTKSVTSKAFVAIVAAAMLFSLVAPAAKAQTAEELQAQITALMAQIEALKAGMTTPAPVGGNCAAIPAPLTMNATGANVTALQNYLISAGQSIPAGATGFFGGQTKAALAAWQSANGVTPPAGYYGPITAAAMAAKCVPTVPTTPTTPTTPGATLEGGAGSISVSNHTTDLEKDVNTGDSQNILGFKIEADGSDVEVTNLKLSLEYTGSASNRLERYFESFDIVFDGETVGSMDARDFSRDSAGKYSKTLSLKNTIIREGDKETFYVVGNASSDIDSGNTGSKWKITADNFRYVDGQGAIISETSSGITASGIEVIRLASSTDVKVKVSLSTENPAAGAVRVSPDSSGDEITLLSFRIKAEGTDVGFDQVKFVLSPTGKDVNAMVTEFRLMSGSKILATENAPAGTQPATSSLVMSLDDTEYVDQDDTATYTLVAKMAKNNFSGSSLKAEIASPVSGSVNAEDNNGDSIANTRFSGSAVGNVQTFRGNGMFAAVNGTPKTALQSKTVNNTSMQYGEFTFTLDVSADGDDFYLASTSASIVPALLLSSGAPASASTSSWTVTSDATKTGAGNYVIYDGETKKVTVTYTMALGYAADNYKLQLATLKYGATEAAVVAGATSIGLTPVGDFTSGTVNIQ